MKPPPGADAILNDPTIRLSVVRLIFESLKPATVAQARELLTLTVDVVDYVEGRRRLKKERAPVVELTEDVVAKVRELLAAGKSHRMVAKALGVSRYQVYRVATVEPRRAGPWPQPPSAPQVPEPAPAVAPPAAAPVVLPPPPVSSDDQAPSAKPENRKTRWTAERKANFNADYGAGMRFADLAQKYQTSVGAAIMRGRSLEPMIQRARSRAIDDAKGINTKLATIKPPAAIVPKVVAQEPPRPAPSPAPKPAKGNPWFSRRGANQQPPPDPLRDVKDALRAVGARVIFRPA